MTPKESLHEEGEPSPPGSAVRRSGILMASLLLIGTAALVSVFLVVKGRDADVPPGTDDAGRAGAVDAPSARSLAFPSDYPRGAKPATPFELVDQEGQKVRLADYRGRVVYLAFAFGGCHGACPVLLKSLEATHKRFDEFDSAKRPAMLIVSLDPQRDIPSTLPSTAKRWGLLPGMQFLSGPVDDVEAVIAAWNIPRENDPKTGEIIHPPMVFVIDQSGHTAYSLNNPSTAWIEAAGRRLLAEHDQASGH